MSGAWKFEYVIIYLDSEGQERHPPTVYSYDDPITDKEAWALARRHLLDGEKIESITKRCVVNIDIPDPDISTVSKMEEELIESFFGT